MTEPDKISSDMQKLIEMTEMERARTEKRKEDRVKYTLVKRDRLRWFVNKLLLESKEPVFGDPDAPYKETIYFSVDLLNEKPDFFSLPYQNSNGEADYDKREIYLEYCKEMLQKIKQDIYKLENNGLTFDAKKFTWSTVDEYWHNFDIYMDYDLRPIFEAYLRFMDNPNVNTEIIGDVNKKMEFLNDLKWEEVMIRFLNGNEVIITTRGKTRHTDYEEMGFKDKKTKNPNVQWDLLRLLSIKGGSLNWNNTGKLTIKEIGKIKKRKQLLSDKLQEYFNIVNDDPFLNYKKEGAYKIKISLIPEESSKIENNIDADDPEFLDEDDQF